MNLKEGTRRLALLLGVAGAIAAGFVSYFELQTVIDQRGRHNKFEQLATSDVVKDQRKILQSPDPYASIAKPIPHHGRAKLNDTAPPSPPPVEWDANGNPIRYAAAQPVEYDADGKPIAATSSTAPPIRGDFLDGATPLSSEVNKGDIKTINWSHDYGVGSIETADGQTLYPTEAPSAWLYLLAALFPVFGFIIPWSVVRAIGWVGAGFVASAK